MAPFPVEKSGGFKPTLGHTVHKSVDFIFVIFEEVKTTYDSGSVPVGLPE